MKLDGIWIILSDGDRVLETWDSGFGSAVEKWVFKAFLYFLPNFEGKFTLNPFFGRFQVPENPISGTQSVTRLSLI